MHFKWQQTPLSLPSFFHSNWCNLRDEIHNKENKSKRIDSTGPRWRQQTERLDESLKDADGKTSSHQITYIMFVIIFIVGKFYHTIGALQYKNRTTRLQADQPEHYKHHEISTLSL